MLNWFVNIKNILITEDNSTEPDKPATASSKKPQKSVGSNFVLGEV